MMIVSLNEIEGTMLKAVRGAGLAWGIAEDAAAAARWLAAWQLPWLATAPALLRACEAAAGDREVALRHPLLVGTWLADLGRPVGAGTVETLPRIEVPLWLVGSLALATRGAGEAIAIRWRSAELRLGNGALLAAAGDLAASAGAPVTVERLPASARGPDLAGAVPARRLGGVPADPDTWDLLLAYEKRIYVPATQQSRAAGAGAGTSDND